MHIIIVSRPDFFEGETELVNDLFQQGVIQRLHLRKPKASLQEMAEWIERIALPFRHLIVLHDHHDLALQYELGGIHLNQRHPQPPDWVNEVKQLRPFTVSRSCHTLEEIRCYRDCCDYLFLSPIFDSISKEGYGAAFSREELRQAQRQGLLSSHVYALGGVSSDRLPELESMGFTGAAMLGAFWNQWAPR